MHILPQRKQLRLKDYNYSQIGYYFVTICTQVRKILFGQVVVAVGEDSLSAHPQMILNNAGRMINMSADELILFARIFNKIKIDMS
jgi:putative transposase